jgi:hypothetical protein
VQSREPPDQDPAPAAGRRQSRRHDRLQSVGGVCGNLPSDPGRPWRA